MALFRKKIETKPTENKHLVTSSGQKIHASDPMYYVFMQIHSYKRYLHMTLIFLGLCIIGCIIAMVVLLANDELLYALIPICIAIPLIYLIVRKSIQQNHFAKDLKLFSQKYSQINGSTKVLPRFLTTIYKSIKHRYITTHIVSIILFLLLLTFIVLHNLDIKHNWPGMKFFKDVNIYIDVIVIFCAVIILYPLTIAYLLKRKSEIEIVFNRGRELSIWNHRKSVLRRLKEQKEHQKLRLRVEETDNDYQYKYDEKKLIIGDNDPYED